MGDRPIVGNARSSSGRAHFLGYQSKHENSITVFPGVHEKKFPAHPRVHENPDPAHLCPPSPTPPEG